MLALLFAAALLAGPPRGAAAQEVGWTRTLHVDYEGGDDSADGLTPRTARKTVPPPQALRPGDRILFKGGVRYQRMVKVERGGTRAAPILYDGNSRREWGEGRAILDGSRALGPWTRAGTTGGGLAIWRTSLEPLRNSRAWGRKGSRPAVFQNGRLGRMASSADWQDNWQGGDLRLFFRVDRDLATNRSITDPVDLKPLGAAGWDQARVELQHGNNHLDIFRVTRFDARTGTIYHEPTRKLRAGDPSYAVLNHPAVFDVPGEHLIDEDADAFFYIPFDGIDPNRAEIRFAAVYSGVNNPKSSHVIVRGFRVTGHRTRGVMIGSNRSLDRRENVVVEDNVLEQGGGIMLVRTDGSIVRDNRVVEVLRDQPILIRRSDRVVVAGNVTRRARTGITASGVTNSLFIGNDARGSLGVHGNAMTFYEGSHNTRIIGNRTQSGRARMGIALRESDGLLLAFNVVRGSRFAVVQWAQTKGGDRLEFYNNTFFGKVRIRPETAARSTFANNFIDAFEMQHGLERIPVRVHNVYGRLVDASVPRGRLRVGESVMDQRAAFRFAEGDPLDAHPTPEGWARLSRGASYELGGTVVSHVGALDAQGRTPDLRALVGLPPPDPSLVHR